MGDKQSQRAGDGSNLYQAQTVNIYQGIDETRAREIVKEQLPEILGAYSQEAQSVAENRVSQFANELIPKLVKDNLLDSLRDPSIQILLKEAEKTAASTERTDDYALLSELLVHRMKNNQDRNVRSGVNHAIRIVDEITDESLLGLTVAHSVSAFVPAALDVNEGLKALDHLFSTIIYNALPCGEEWLDQLDILNAIRINSFGTLKKIKQFYPEILSGYVDVGIKKDSTEYNMALDIIKNCGLPHDVIRDHELRQGFVRLRITNINKLETISISKEELVTIEGQQHLIPIRRRLNKEQQDAFKSIHELYNTDASLREENIEVFMDMWNSFESLRIMRGWWDAIPRSFETTYVGKVLAHANAQRCDPTLPALG